jgi:hypothetical protein
MQTQQLSRAPLPAASHNRLLFLCRCVHNLQIGDWGRQGISEQRKAAQMMATVAACMPPAFIISTGDNFYSRE